MMSLELALDEAEDLAYKGDMIGARKRLEEYHRIRIPEAMLAHWRDDYSLREEDWSSLPLRDRLIRYAEHVRTFYDAYEHQSAHKKRKKALAGS